MTTTTSAGPIGTDLLRTLKTLKLGPLAQTLPERLTLARQRNLKARTGAPPLTTQPAASDAHSHHQVVPCSWQRGGHHAGKRHGWPGQSLDG